MHHDHCQCQKFCLILSLVPVTALAAYEVYSGTCGDNLTWVLDENGTLTISGTGPMYDFSEMPESWNSLPDSVRNVIIEEGVTSIGDYAFEGCYQLYDIIIIPGSVDSIGNFAFALCNGLESITIPQGVTCI